MRLVIRVYALGMHAGEMGQVIPSGHAESRLKSPRIEESARERNSVHLDNNSWIVGLTSYQAVFIRVMGCPTQSDIPPCRGY